MFSFIFINASRFLDIQQNKGVATSDILLNNWNYPIFFNQSMKVHIQLPTDCQPSKHRVHSLR